MYEAAGSWAPDELIGALAHVTDGRSEFPSQVTDMDTFSSAFTAGLARAGLL